MSDSSADVLLDLRVAGLTASVARLRGLVEPLSPEQLRDHAYPTEWTIAQVLSHLGSGAVIFHRRLDASLAGEELDDGFAPTVWEQWNAKTPDEQAADALVADAALLERLTQVTADEQARFQLTLGPFTMGYTEFVGLRLNEHVMHTWDVEVALDPGATLTPAAAALLVDNLELAARLSAEAPARASTVRVRTHDPARSFVLALGPDGVTLEHAADGGAGDIDLPAEAFARLVYGRLGPTTADAGAGQPELDQLRDVFTGL